MRNVRLDHTAINTTDLDASIAFYEHYLGLRSGWRPDFGFPGAWLYPEDGDQAIVHLVGRDEAKGPGGMLDHVAFRGVGLAAYLDKVRAGGGWFRVAAVPGTPLTQVHHRDPNGVKIEVTFAEALPDPG